MNIWGLTVGHAGFESQALGLAEALGGDITLKRVEPKFPWAYVPPGLALPAPSATVAGSDPLEPPWPDILISCGRRVVGLALAIKRASAGRTLAVHIQDPLVDSRRFDLVVAPAHDEVSGANVITTRGAIHRVTRAKLDAAAIEFGPSLAHLPRPLIAVLIGGSNRRHRMTAAATAAIADALIALTERHGAGLAITASRRTGSENSAALRTRLGGRPAVFWDGTGANPYFGYLALADAIVVTEDSVSMISEAAATGRPVYVAALEGGSPRFTRFHESLREAGITRPLDGTFTRWRYEPIDDTATVAREVERLLAQRVNR
jgi:hypothetical protein